MSIRKYFVAVRQRFPRFSEPLIAVVLGALHKYRSFRNSPSEIVLDNLSKCVVEDICVDVPEFGGRFYLNPKSALFRRVVRDGHYEPELSNICSQYIKPDFDVLDIGANIGFHSVLFANLAQNGRVLAVEPTSNALRRLNKNLALNNAKSTVIVHKGAVSDSAGIVDIKVIKDREEFSTLGEMSHQAVSGEQWVVEKVECDTLDALVQRYKFKPKFIKVDVEGLEYQVFSGGSHTLNFHRPVILAELSNIMLERNGSSASKVIEILSNADYNVFNANRPAEPPGVGDYGEIICLPR